MTGISTTDTTTTVPIVFTETETYIATPCPDYCKLPPMHSVDGYGGGPTGDVPLVRVHGGPKFGRFLDGYAEEYVSSPGVLKVGVDLCTGNDAATLLAGELELLAQDALRAAEWLRAHQ